MPSDQLAYISLGVPRFTKEVFKQLKMNYSFYKQREIDFPFGHDDKHKYSHAKKGYVLNAIKSLLNKSGISEDKIYLCMEEG